MEHEGVIIAIYQDVVCVQIKQQSACHDCHAQKACGMADVKEKIIEIPYISGNYNIGDTICIVGKTSMGLKAVLYAFVIPLLIGLFSLILAPQIDLSEVSAAIAALGTIAIYYMVIYFCRDKLKQKFTFTIK